MGKLETMDHTGHSTIDTVDPESIAKGQAKFDEIIKQGGAAFERTGPGERKQVKTFDPNADTLLIPQQQGG